MSILKYLQVFVFCLISIAMIGCGGGEESKNADDNNNSATIYKAIDYYPLETGNTWVYNLGTVQVLDETYTFSGRTGQRVENWGLDCVAIDAFLAQSEEGVVFYGEYNQDDEEYTESPFDETFVLLSKEMRIGDSWTNAVASLFSLTYRFMGLETITVPAGTFPDSLKISVEAVDDGTYTTVFWYAKNVGLIKIERTAESPSGHDGCMVVTSAKPLAQLQSALVNGVSYP